LDRERGLSWTSFLQFSSLSSVNDVSHQQIVYLQLIDIDSAILGYGLLGYGRGLCRLSRFNQLSVRESWDAVLIEVGGNVAG
jgi:hypothetical protein